jgi:predicted nucleotidyltransferase
MKYGLSSNNLKRITQVLKQFPGIETVYLYGSRAKGNYKPSSDVDLMLKGDKLDLKQLTSVMTELDDLLLPYTFDIAIYHQIENNELLDHIKRVGIDLYSISDSVAS